MGDPTDPVDVTQRDTIRSPPPDPPFERPDMTASTIVQCDLCPALTGNDQTFCKVEIDTVPPWGDGTGNPDYRESKAKAVLCPKCAAPLLAFQQAIIDGGVTHEDRQARAGKLNERILSAIRQTE